MGSWKGNLLTMVGREILIKVVAQATPMYTMNCFKLPDSLCNELNYLIRNFWCGQRDKERKLAWLAWEKMCIPKSEGGMGFKDLKAFNLALLAKQGWRLVQNTESLAHRVLKARYFPNSSFLEAQVGKNSSYTWWSLMAAQEVLRRGLRWNIGNGRKTKIWVDRWIPIPNSFMVASPRPQNFESELVEYFIDRETGGWDTSAVKNVFLPFEVEAILSIPISPSLPEDALIWAWTKKGDFMVKSAYQVALKWLAEDRGREAGGEESNVRRKKEFWTAIWGLNFPNKVKMFMWRACKNILPTNYCLWQ